MNPAKKLVPFISMLLVTGSVVAQQVYTDRPHYLAGDTVRYAIIHEQSPDLLLRVRFTGMNHNPHADQMIAFENGMATGKISVSDSLSAGVYSLNIFSLNRSTPLLSHPVTVFKYPLHSGQPPALPVYVKQAYNTSFTVEAEANNRKATDHTVTIDLNLNDGSYNGPLAVSVTDGRQVPLSPVNHLNDTIHWDAKGVNTVSLSGTLRQKNTGNLLTNRMIILSATSGTPLFKYTYTDNKGHFQFKNLRYEEGTRLLISLNPMNNEANPFPLAVNDLNTIPSPDAHYALNLRAADIKLELNHKTGVIARFMDYKSKVTGGLEVYENTKPFSWGKTLAESEHLDVHVDFDVFASLGNMDEVVRDVIPFLSLKSKKNNPYFQVFSPEKRASFPENPLFFIDGVPHTDPGAFLSLSPENLQYVSVITTTNNLRKFGVLGSRGVVIVRTRGKATPDLDHSVVVVPRGITRSTNNGIFNPKPDAVQRPDFRRTLFWNPAVMPDKKGNYRFTLTPSSAMNAVMITVEYEHNGKRYRNTIALNQAEL